MRTSNLPSEDEKCGGTKSTPGHCHSVKIALLHSLSGTMALSERSLLEAELMAVDEINNAGGILGLRVDPLVPDCASQPTQFALAAQDCLSSGALALFGCWTSASRKAVRTVVESADSLLWYPVQYEGLEESPCICYTGSCLNQQIIPAVEWIFGNYGKRLFLVGSDYVFPRTANQLIRSLVTSRGGSTVNECYVPLGEQDFNSIIAQILEMRPDAVINTINGDSNLAFYRKCRDAGLSPAEIPIMATSVTETELEPVAAAAEGHFACWSYFQSLDTPENKSFLKRINGRKAESSPVSAPIVTAYSQIYLWKKVVERAGSFVPAEVRRNLSGCGLSSPMGELRIEQNHHLSLPVRIGRLQSDGQFAIVWESEKPVAPLPWLGVESMEFPGKEMVRQSMAAFADYLNYSNLLEKEIAERKILEAALEKTRASLEQTVEIRTQELVETIDELNHEVAERQQAEEELKKSEERYRLVADFTYDWEYWHGPDGKMIYCSPACERITGYPPEKFTADPDFLIKITHPDDREKVALHLSTVGEINPDLETHDFRILALHGETRWIGHACQNVWDAQGKYMGRRASNRDITVMKQHEMEKDKLEGQNRQMQKSESLGRMAAAIAHLFNNQLQAILGNLEMARAELPEGFPAVGGMLSNAMMASRRAAEVSGLMLSYLGQNSAARTPLDLTEICRLSLPMLQTTLPRNVVLETDLSSPGQIISANANQLQQIMTALITNAWESIQENSGIVRVCVKRVAAGAIPLSRRYPINAQKLHPSYACLEVRDTGCGIPAENMDSLFDPFFTTKFTGRGMGLAGTLGIVRACGGMITVESKPGEGSTFSVFLPLIEDISAELPEYPRRTAEQRVGNTILVVEDEAMIRAMTASMLKRLGYQALTARDGVEAIEVFDRYKEEIICVLCDLTMPRMDGWETLATLHKIAPSLPVILASGYSEAQVMAASHSELPHSFLGKPYTRERLASAIRRATT
jgi:urea ABC transporter urea binding protein